MAEPSVLFNVTVTFLSSTPTFSLAQTSNSVILPLVSFTVYTVDVNPTSTPERNNEAVISIF